jgi:hypothetical protein
MSDDETDELLSSIENATAAHAVMLSLSTENGMMLSGATYEKAQRWWAARQVTFHLSHFSTCPARESFRRTDGKTTDAGPKTSEIA